MFNALFHKAQVTVDHAIGQAVNRVLVAIPFLIAVGFATAALAVRSVRELGPETGLLAMAILYGVLGVIVAPFLIRAPAASMDTVAPAAAGAPSMADGTEASDKASSSPAVDRELVAATLSTVAPMALPAVVRMIMTNLPLVTAIAALLYIFTREAPVEEAPVTS